MPRAIAITGLLAALALGAFWQMGGMDAFALWAQDAQRAAQDRIADALRALRLGAPGALAGLWGLCFAYGFAHAIGPGHGKMVMGAYGVGTETALTRLAAIAMLAAFGQAVTAILLVFAGAGLLGLTRTGMEEVAGDQLERVGLFAILALGLWLVFRGARGMVRQRNQLQGAQDACPGCGHTHAPDPAQVTQARSLREVAALIAAISLRPCTGALFVLILTWRMGLVWQGVGAVLAMALGTGLVTVAAALLAGGARRGAFAMPSIARLAPAIEVAAGGAIAILTLNMLNYL